MSKELLDIVDDDDNVIGQATRDECHKNNLTHRTVMFFVFDQSNKVLVTKRTENKDFFPGYWSIAIGGHVSAGQTYEIAAKREIEEETGIAANPFPIGSFQKRITEEKENVRVFGVRADPLHLNLDPREIEHGEFLTLNELEEKLTRERFLPETAQLLEILTGFFKSRLPRPPRPTE